MLEICGNLRDFEEICKIYVFVFDGAKLERDHGIDLSNIDISRFNVMKPRVNIIDDPDTRIPNDNDINSCPNLCQEWFNGCNKCLCNFGETEHCTKKQCNNHELQLKMCIKWKKEAFDRGLVSKIASPHSNYNRKNLNFYQN